MAADAACRPGEQGDVFVVAYAGDVVDGVGDIFGVGLDVVQLLY